MPSIFLLEVLIFKINFEYDGESISTKDDILVNVRFSDMVNMDIAPENFPVLGEQPIVPSPNVTVDLNMGKTYLFDYIASDLIMELKTLPLELLFRVKRKPIGTALIPWKSEFSDMVKIYETIGVVKSVDYNGTVDILEEDIGKVGSVDLFIRLSCFGSSIETDFRMDPLTDEFTFMNPRTMATFKCEGFDPRTTFVTPVSSIYHPVLNVPVPTNTATSQISWTELFGGGVSADAKLSVAPMAVDDEDFFDKLGHATDKDMEVSRSAFDIVSMVFRPPENKFFDFLNMVSAEVATKEEETMVTLTFDKQNSHKKLTTIDEQRHVGERRATFVEETLNGKEKEVKEKQKEKEKEVEEKKPDPALEMTAEMFAKKLCKNKDCPGAKKFKEFGIGPLATGAGLGTLYTIVEPPVSYGLSHTYGTLSNYGPYGLFTRPKDPNQPFIPRKKPSETPLSTCPNSKIYSTCNHKLKLKDVSAISENGNGANISPKCPMAARLRGGGLKENHSCGIQNICFKWNQIFAAKEVPVVFYQEQSCSSEANSVSRYTRHSLQTNFSPVLRLRGGGPVDLDLYGPRSPFLECKPVMDQFDQILAAYKKALGPCGEATCPYAQNLAEVSCKKLCDQPVVSEKIEDAQDVESVSCNSIPCSMESCPYREPKKKKFLAGCGSPQCAYTKYKLGLIDDDAALELQFLPPAISGKCGHPKCPYPLKSDLPPIHWDCPDPLPKGNCKNPECPFLPQELKMLKCPGLRKGPCGSTTCPYALPAPCDLASCPFRQKPCPFLEEQQNNKEDASCSLSSRDERICENPDCPFTKKEDEVSTNLDSSSIKGEFTKCENPDCPFTRKDEEIKKLKSCRVAKKSIQSPCGNPDCPFTDVNPEKAEKKKKQRKSSGENPGQLEAANDICENPQCPFQKKIKKNSAGEVCDNPNCPFAEKKNAIGDKGKIKRNICDNPECPFVKKKSDEPICNDPYCPYAQPLPSCGVPNCPYEPVPVLNVTSEKSSKRGSKEESCDKKLEEDVVLVETETTLVCEEAPEQEEYYEESQPKIEKKKKKRRGKFVYSTGDKYPGVKIGHRECVTPVFNVPPRMGWLWNIHTPILRLKPRKGWKPGAIVRTIADRIRAHRQMKGLGILNVPKFRKDRKGIHSDDEINVSPKPTLHIQKKDGSYWITMNPLKDPLTLADNEDPYMECTPMQFKITKNKQKPAIEGETDSKTCCCEEENLSSSSNSELDIEFTPPAGIIHPERFKKKKNVVHCDTQYDPTDFENKKEKISGSKVSTVDVGSKKEEREAGEKKSKGVKEGKGGKEAKGEKVAKGTKGKAKK
ncbi:uncharacterized protein isoform X1 [Leptinotarsa decemlineata]|uniref:uncharacterized protein isoform X1 n=1 Tax=Leptinotarsa decemlineata TaxID=7539 RepID=UPI003D3096CD